MKPPTTVHIGPFRYKLVLAQDHQEFSQDRGTIHHTLLEIRVDEKLAYDHQRKTVLHEVLHGCFMVANDGIAEKLTEEQWVHRVTGVLLDTLQRNPELVGYLTA